MISIIIPIIRPEKAKRCISAINADGFTGEIIAVEDKWKIGCPEMVKELVAKAKGDVICFIGDDTIPRPDWLKIGLEKMYSLPDGWGVVGLRTVGSSPCAHWLADRRMLDLTGGEFFSTEYRHFFCDNELMDIAVENGRFVLTDEIILDHDHPINGGGDEKHIDTNGDTYNIDLKTYYRRKRERINGIAIGFPLLDDEVPIQFFATFTCMDKPFDYNILFPKFPHGPFSGSVADARNSLVQQAQMDGAKWLLMCDTDQVYPANTLTRLLSHGKHVCGVSVHRRWPPYDRIFYRGELGKYQNVPDEESFSGNLIEVDATGTGCLLFDMAIFDDIEQPWFKFEVREGKTVGEDIYFCSKAREAGKRIYVDTSIEVGHLATLEVNRAIYEVHKALNKKKMEA